MSETPGQRPTNPFEQGFRMGYLRYLYKLFMSQLSSETGWLTLCISMACVLG